MIAGRLLERIRDGYDKAIRNAAPSMFILEQFETMLEVTLVGDQAGWICGLAGPSPVIGEHLLVTLITPFDISEDWSLIAPRLYQGYEQLLEGAHERLNGG